MSAEFTRRAALASLAGLGVAGLVGPLPEARAAKYDPKWEKSIEMGLKWVAKSQSNRGHWDAGSYPTAMTALGGLALLCSGSTTTQGPYSKNISRAVDFLIDMAARRSGGATGKLQPRHEGLIGDPFRDRQYTYGHGFSMLFLSQVLGEEEDGDRRSELIDVLTEAAKFAGKAQTKKGGWGYVSAKDGNDFDEGSTTITQVQGLRGCRNAGIPVPKEIIDRAKAYIYMCKNADGGVSYSSQNMGTSRPAITAAALACLYNAGEYDSKQTKDMMEYCKKQLGKVTDEQHAFGHWHYTYLYYSQVVYREGGKTWEEYRDKVYNKIVSQQQASDGSWTGNIGPIYVSACNLIMLQLDKGLIPIYQK